MLHARSLVGCIAAMVFAVAGLVANASDSRAAGTVTWKSGLQYASEDGGTKIKIGGRLMNDWAFLEADDDLKAVTGNLEDGTEFRRVRLAVSGLLFEEVEFKSQLDFAGGEASFKDVWMGLKDLPVLGKVRVGQMHEPFSLEELTSSNNITFMERSLHGAFVPSRQSGILASNGFAEGRGTWSAGVFKRSDSQGVAQEDGQADVTARVTALPRYEEKGRKLVHLGVSASHSNPAGDAVNFSQRPESHLGPKLVSTGKVAAENLQIVGLEGAMVEGPLSLQGEFVLANVDRLDMESVAFNGFYAQGSFFLTGEHRAYKTAEGKFDRVKPNANFNKKNGGSGAWEFAARFSRIDLEDGDVAGGILSDVTLGVNWYINPNARVMANYVYADLDGVGVAHIGQTRFQVDF